MGTCKVTVANAIPWPIVFPFLSGFFPMKPPARLTCSLRYFSSTLRGQSFSASRAAAQSGCAPGLGTGVRWSLFRQRLDDTKRVFVQVQDGCVSFHGVWP